MKLKYIYPTYKVYLAEDKSVIVRMIGRYSPDYTTFEMKLVSPSRLKTGWRKAYSGFTFLCNQFETFYDADCIGSWKWEK